MMILENQEFGRDTNRVYYFRVVAFDVHGNDSIIENSSFGDGCFRRDYGVVNGGGDMNPQVLVEKFAADNGGDGDEMAVQSSELQEMSNGGCDVKGGGRLVGWLKKWWWVWTVCRN